MPALTVCAQDVTVTYFEVDKLITATRSHHKKRIFSLPNESRWREVLPQIPFISNLVLSKSSHCEHTSKAVTHTLCPGWRFNRNPLFSPLPSLNSFRMERYVSCSPVFFPHRHCVIQSMAAVEIKK